MVTLWQSDHTLIYVFHFNFIKDNSINYLILFFIAKLHAPNETWTHKLILHLELIEGGSEIELQLISLSYIWSLMSL